MARKRIPDHQLTHEQLMRRIRNERYRSKVTPIINETMIKENVSIKKKSSQSKQKNNMNETQKYLIVNGNNYVDTNENSQQINETVSMKASQSTYDNVIQFPSQSIHKEPSQNVSNERPSQINSFLKISQINSFLKISQIILAALLCLIIISSATTFLVYEQMNFFKTCGFSEPIALFISVTLEFILVALSVTMAIFRKTILKVGTSLLLIVGLFLVGKIVAFSASNRSDTKLKKTEVIQQLDQEIKELETVSKESLANIQAMDPIKFPTKREQLLKKYETTIAPKLMQKREERSKSLLTTATLMTGETEVMAFMRWFLMLVNVFFAHVLVHVVRRKEHI